MLYIEGDFIYKFYLGRFYLQLGPQFVSFGCNSTYPEPRNRVLIFETSFLTLFLAGKTQLTWISLGTIGGAIFLVLLCRLLKKCYCTPEEPPVMPVTNPPVLAEGVLPGFSQISANLAPSLSQFGGNQFLPLTASQSQALALTGPSMSRLSRSRLSRIRLSQSKLLQRNSTSRMSMSTSRISRSRSRFR